MRAAKYGGPAGVPRSGCGLGMMEVSGPQNHSHHAGRDEDSGFSAELSPARFREKCAEGGRASSSSVEAGQESVIALLLQQQELVLKEIRDQKKVRIVYEYYKQ